MACAAGKDVYVEKPLTVYIDEGKWMLQAMNKYKRVVNKRDWIDCIKSRKTPFCNLEMGHRTAIICNLGNLSLRLGGRHSMGS